MLLQNEGQILYLQSIEEKYKMVWYLSERDILQEGIIELFDMYSSNVYKFESVLKKMWKAEIIRIYVILLNLYKKVYVVDSEKNHWRDLLIISKKHNFLESASKYLSIISKLVFNEKDKEINQLATSVDEILNEHTFKTVKLCLLELARTNQIIPQVVVEPIETPHSHFEKKRSLASSVVRALLDVYMEDFYRTKDNPFRVRLVIPWHRLTSEIKFPQKTTDIKGFVSWRRDELFKFISNRIDWEFKAVNRKLTKRYQPKLAWYEFFEGKVKNGWVEPNYEEDSFDYFIRHTHYRSRDLINLCKKCVEYAFNNGNFDSLDDVLRKGFITQKMIKETFHEYNQDAAKELLEEAVRKYRGFSDYPEAIYRLPIVFSYDQLTTRLQKYGIDENTEEVILKMWESGFLGVTVESTDFGKIELIETFSSHVGRKTFRGYTRWTWFFYNSKKTPIELIRMVESIGCKDHGYCLHPKLFETYTPIVAKKLNVPIGV
ncbi:MAG: hypothetical protein AAF399_13570 [Bacteroidota bacterium]